MRQWLLTAEQLKCASQKQVKAKPPAPQAGLVSPLRYIQLVSVRCSCLHRHPKHHQHGRCGCLPRLHQCRHCPSASWSRWVMLPEGSGGRDVCTMPALLAPMLAAHSESETFLSWSSRATNFCDGQKTNTQIFSHWAAGRCSVWLQDSAEMMC